jgi:tetratricopeptide (TPR) repeat protein
MQKQRSRLVRLAALSLSTVALWSSAARAADPPPPASSSEQTSPPGSPPTRLVPEQFSQLYKINDDNPEANVPTAADRTANPLEFGYFLQDLLTRAEVAEKRKDQAGVIKYYRAVAATLPEEARGWSLLCQAYETARDRDRAVRACKYAIERKGAELKDYQRYVALMTAKPDDLLPEERRDVNEVLEHLDKQPDLAIPTAHLRCEAAIKMNDAAALAACSTVLAKAAPNDPKTVVFQWSLAVMRGDREQAGTLLERAEKMGLAAASIDRMSQVSVAGHWWSSPGRGVVGVVIVVGAAALFGLLLLVTYRRRLASSRRLAE